MQLKEKAEEQNISLSDYYCLPNKLFEYAFAEIPVLASNFPDISMVVEKYTSVRVKLTQSSYKNIKITTPDDIIIAESFIKK